LVPAKTSCKLIFEFEGRGGGGGKSGRKRGGELTFLRYLYPSPFCDTSCRKEWGKGGGKRVKEKKEKHMESSPCPFTLKKPTGLILFRGWEGEG